MSVINVRCQYWQPGRESWVQHDSIFEHKHGAAAYLGDGEVILVGGSKVVANSHTEILENGAWAEKANNGLFPGNLRLVYFSC